MGMVSNSSWDAVERERECEETSRSEDSIVWNRGGSVSRGGMAHILDSSHKVKFAPSFLKQKKRKNVPLIMYSKPIVYVSNEAGLAIIIIKDSM